MKRLLATLYAYFRRDLAVAVSYRIQFAMQAVSIIVMVASFYFMSKLVGQHPTLDKFGGYLPFAVIGFAASSFLLTGFSSFAQALRNEQVWGTLEAVLMTPTRLWHVILSSTAWDFLFTLVTAVITVAAAVLMFGIQIKGSLLMAFALLLLTTINFTCFGVMSAAFIMIFKRGDPFRFLVQTSTFLLGGVVYPVTELPQWLRAVSYLLPVTHGLQGIRETLLLGRPAAEVLPQMGILLLFLLVNVPLSLWCFRKSYVIATREGSLVHY